MNGFNGLVTKCCTLRLIAVCHAKDFDLTMKICKSSQQADKKGILWRIKTLLGVKFGML